MNTFKKVSSTVLLGLVGSSAFAACYDAPGDTNRAYKFRFCEKSGVDVIQKIVDQTAVVESRLKNGATLKTKSGSVNVRIGHHYNDTVIGTQFGQVNIPSQLKDLVRTHTVNWPNASQKVPCGYKARFELWSVVHRKTYYVMYGVPPVANYKNTGKGSYKDTFMNGKAVFKNMGKLSGGTRC